MTTNRMGLEQTLSDADLIAIASAAEEVISAIAGDNEEVHPDNSTKMCALWDDLNDRHAPPAVVKAVVLELLARRNASKEPVAYADPIALQGFSNFREHPGSDIIIRGREWMWAKADSGLLPLFAAPPPQAVTAPMKDHQIRELVNDLRDIAVKYHGTQQLRERIARAVRSVMLKSVTNEP